MLPPKKEKMKRKVSLAVLTTHSPDAPGMPGTGCGGGQSDHDERGRLGSRASAPGTDLMSVWCEPSRMQVEVPERDIIRHFTDGETEAEVINV